MPRFAIAAVLLLGWSTTTVLDARADQPEGEPPDGDIRRVAEEWKDRVFLVVADAGPVRAPVEQVLRNPRVLYRKRRVGCAVYLEDRRYLLTTASVVRRSTEVEVFDDSGQHVLARVVGVDPHLDLALLEAVEDLPGTEAYEPLRPAESPPAGGACLVLGSAYGRSLSATLGTLGETVDIAPQTLPVLVRRVNAPIYPGDSGGPVLDPEGRFLGIVTAIAPQEHTGLPGEVADGEIRELRMRPASSSGLALPAGHCRQAWEDLRHHGHVKRGYLGVWAARDDHGGARIREVVPGGPAEAAGIQAGDRITMFGHLNVTNPLQFCALVAGTTPRSRVDIRLIRGEYEHIISLTLGEAKRLPGRVVPPGPPAVSPSTPVNEVVPVPNGN